MTPAVAVQVEASAGASPPTRWLVFVTCAAALFVFSYGSEYTWSAVQRAWEEGFGAQLDSVVKQSAAGNLSRQVAAITLGVVGLAAIFTRRPATELRAAGALAALLIAYLAVLFLSAAWSNEPQLTIRRAIAFILVVVAVVGMVRMLPRDAIVSFAFFASAAYVLIAIAAEGAGGAIHPLAPEYRFSGVYHPNSLGSFAAILVMAATCTDRRKVRPSFVAVAVVVGVAVVLLTRSRSAALGLVAALTIRWLIAARLSRTVFALAVCGWMACAVFLAFGDAAGSGVLDALVAGRRDSDVETLSGRTALWDELLLRHVSQRPMLGYGFGSFWDTRHIQEIFAALRWPVTEAHSTYIQQLLDAGAIGLTLYVLVIAAAVARAIRRLRATGDGAYAFMLCVLLYIGVVGFLETVHPNPGFPSFLLLWTFALLAFGEAAPSEGRHR